MLSKILGVNWRTSLTGYATALFLIVYPIIQNGDFEIKRDWGKIILAILASLYGKVSKDAMVTGTPKQNEDAR